MEEDQKIIEINSAYVDEHLRGFFDVEQTPVNIDNICLFSAKTIEEYNSHSETKLLGRQKLEAACELARGIIDKVMVFVPEDQRRKTSKNIYHNLDSIESTIQFIVNISNNPNMINSGKWVRADTIIKKTSRGCFSRLFSCSGKGKSHTEKSSPLAVEDPKKESKAGTEETNEIETKAGTEETNEIETKAGTEETKRERKERKLKEAKEKKEKIEQEKKERKERKLKEAKEKKEKIEQEKKERKDEEERRRKEKKERERKIKELLEETERKVKELKTNKGDEERKSDATEQAPTETSDINADGDGKENNVDIEI
jgi:hypothetical protein